MVKKPYEPPGLEPKYQKILEEEKAKLAERARVVEEHGERLMQTLVHIKKHHGVSILLIAHTPKRHSRGTDNYQPPSGSGDVRQLYRQLFRPWPLSPRTRYPLSEGHQAPEHRRLRTGCRGGYAADRQTGRFLGFAFEGHALESEHCGWGYGEGSSDAFIQSVLELLAEKGCQRQIAETLNVSLTTVNRCVQAINKH